MRKSLSQTGHLVRQFGVTLILFALGIGCMVPAATTASENRLFTAPAESRGKIDEAMRSRIIRHRLVNVDFGLLASSQEPPKNSTARGAVVILNLFEDAVFRAILDRREVRSSRSFTWFGHIDGVQDSQVTLVVEDRVVSGNVRLDRSFYQIRYAGEGTHVIYQIDPNAFPEEGKPLPVPDSGN
jgi:hypothetical protein